jgi:hypothetical protein
MRRAKPVDWSIACESIVPRSSGGGCFLLDMKPSMPLSSELESSSEESSSNPGRSASSLIEPRAREVDLRKKGKRETEVANKKQGKRIKHNQYT